MRERKVADMPEPMMKEQDLHSVLDRELSQLPEKYRSVIVLCDLEGKTRKEAARELSLPEGTVATRIARARAMLAKRLRLTQPGCAVTAGSLAALLAQNCVSATVPRSLTDATIQTTRLLATGQNAAGVAFTAPSPFPKRL